MRICSRPDCDRPHRARGMCDMHYRRARLQRDPALGSDATGNECTIDDCTHVARARGWCGLHYDRWRRHGDPIVAGDIGMDEIAVDRAAHGDRPERSLTPAERREVVRILHRWKFSDGKIADRLDIGVSGVWTIRRRLGLPANAVGRPARKQAAVHATEVTP